MGHYTLTEKKPYYTPGSWLILVFFCSLACPGFALSDTIPALRKQLLVSQYDTNRVNILNELSYQLQRMDFDSSLRFAEESLVLAEKLTYKKGIALANCRKAYCYLLLGLSKLSLEHALLAKQLAEQEHYQEIIAESYRIMAFSYMDQQEFEIAKNYVQQAEHIALKTNNWRLLSSIYNLTANIERTINPNDTARTFTLYRKALEILEGDKTSEFYGSGVLGNIGGSYLLIEKPDPDKAILYFNKAIEIAQRTNNRVTEAGITGDLGAAYMAKKEYLQANHYLQRSLSLARELKLKRVMRYAYELLSDLKAREGKTDEAIAYLNSFYEINDSIKTTREIVELEAQQAIAVLEQEKKIQHIWNTILIGGTLILIIFITIIYKLQKSRNRKAVELLEVQKELNYKLQETDQLKSKFFANISHEFRTPLSLILGPAERMLISSDSSDDQKKDLRLMSRNANRLLSLINQLLDLSKLEAGKMKLHIEQGNLEEFVKILASSFDSFAETRGINFIKRIEVASDNVGFDRDKVEKIIINILFNAFKFTPSTGEVKLVIHTTPESQLVIEVSDTGKGISENDLQHVFSPFYQSSTLADNGHPGTGLGLSLVQELVKLHDGQVTLASKLGEGTTIRVVLPMIKNELSQKQQLSAVLAPSIKTEMPDELTDIQITLNNDENTETILVVEDSDELRIFIASCFTSAYKVLTAQNGEEGYAMAIEHVPDLVISDVMMPKMNGILLTEKLKDDERTSHIPVILLTAKTDSASRLDGLKKGADDYLPKPFSPEELNVRASNLIESRKKLIARYHSAITLAAPVEETLPPILSLDDKFIANLRNIIHTNLAVSSFSVEQLSEEMCLSRTQLFRKVKSMLGMSPNELINDIRLLRGAELIKAKADTLTQISYSVGFNEQSYFAKRFRKKFGVSPSEYAGQK